jgi:methylmalonyl-CoA mutase
MNEIPTYIPQNKIRIVTAASLFDGHDAAINIMRRIIQATGVEVIHLGHDRSVDEVVNTAIQEDAQAIAMTSYQGGHVEYFKYMRDLLVSKGAGHIQIFGGGGGVILPEEIKELMDYGITRIYSPDDGRKMGLQGMINDMVEKSDVLTPSISETKQLLQQLHQKDVNTIARLITLAENNTQNFHQLFSTAAVQPDKVFVLGITGTGGAGKSSLVDELVRRFLTDFPEKTIGIISVDPSKRKTGGALLGDRIRMNAINHPQVYMRSLATRQSNLALSKHVSDALQILKAAQYDLIILETSGIGQSDTEILDHSDVALYVMTPEFGAPTQLEKIDMLDFADLIAINKFDKRGAEDALRDVKKQYQRNHKLFDRDFQSMPVYGTMASQFNDHGTNELYKALLHICNTKLGTDFQTRIDQGHQFTDKNFVIPPKRVRYLSEIVENNRQYDAISLQQKNIAQNLFGIYQTILAITGQNPEGCLIESGLNASQILSNTQASERELIAVLLRKFETLKIDLHPKNWEKITHWENLKQAYKNPVYQFQVRDKIIEIPNYTESLISYSYSQNCLTQIQRMGRFALLDVTRKRPWSFPFYSRYLSAETHRGRPHPYVCR